MSVSSRLLSRVPFAAALPPWQWPSPHTVMLAALLNRVLVRHIELDRLDSVRGKTMCIRIADLGLSFYLAIGQRGFSPRRHEAQPEVTIAATARDFARLALREEDPDTLFFSRRLVMEGNTEAGLLIKNVLDAVDPAALPLLNHLPDFLRARIAGRNS